MSYGKDNYSRNQKINMKTRLFSQNVLSKKRVIALLFLAVLVWVFPGSGHAYVMPAGQLADLMTANFSKIETMVITQSIHLKNQREHEPERILKEKIWLKAPCYYRSEMINKREVHSMMDYESAADQPTADAVFRLLFMAYNSSGVQALLSKMGINLELVAFTRFEGIIAYRVGDKDPEMPQLLIEKKRFLPLLLSYYLKEGAGRKMVTVRFKEYEELKDGWYPDEIYYSKGDEIKKRYFITDLQSNVPIECQLSKIPTHDIFPPYMTESSDEQGAPPQKKKDSQYDGEEEGLNEIIRVLKEKYH